MNISLVVFDLGRVLIRLCDGWEHACAVAGVDVPQGLGELSAEQLARAEALAAQVDTGAIDIRTYAREIAPLRNLHADDVYRMQDMFLRGPYPGAVELLDQLHAAGIQTACLSNTHDHHWRQMCDPAGMNFLPLQRMTYRFASHLIGARKPDAAIYEHVERAAGAAPESILFFDDLPANVAAAAERGWQAHRVPICENPIPRIRDILQECGAL